MTFSYHILVVFIKDIPYSFKLEHNIISLDDTSYHARAIPRRTTIEAAPS